MPVTRCFTSLALLALLALLLTTGCGALTFTVNVTSGSQELTETVVQSDPYAGCRKVAIVDMSGLIMNGPKPGLLSQGDNPVALFAEQLKKAADDAEVKAVILRINSPGGTVTATDIMYRELLRFKEKTKKPVLVLMMDLAASGGYYLACGGDYIVAYPSTITGSIGVYIQTISFKPAMDRLGIEAEAIKSGKNKTAGSLFGKLTDDHRAVLQSLVDDFYARFRGVVKESRPRIPAERFDDLTDGRVVSGEAALGVGLVDEIGDLHDAYAKVKKMAGIQAASLVLYHRPLDYVATPYAQAGTSGGAAGGGSGADHANVGTQINLFQFNLGGVSNESTIGFYYLWQPSLP
ncbi:MAG: signal peptide peptidase SppA [Phycisphaeraceae bacterium]